MTSLAVKAIKPLVYGSAWKHGNTAGFVLSALKLGFNAIDTACQRKHYNEEQVGQAIQTYLQENPSKSRKDLYIQTKFTPVDGHEKGETPYDPNAPLEEQVQQSFLASQKNLGTPYIDGYILHSPLPKHEDTMRVWGAMEKLQQSGKVINLGISNCYDPTALTKLYDKATVKPTILQNRFYCDTNFDTEIRKVCKDRNIKYQSFWTITANPQFVNDKKFVTFATDKLSMTPVQAYFKYLIDGHDIHVLTGTTNENHMRQDLDILNKPHLHQSQIDEIHNIFKSI